MPRVVKNNISPISQNGDTLHQKAKKLCENGKYIKALKLFLQSYTSTKSPRDAYAVGALIHTLLNNNQVLPPHIDLYERMMAHHFNIAIKAGINEAAYHVGKYFIGRTVVDSPIQSPLVYLRRAAKHKIKDANELVILAEPDKQKKEEMLSNEYFDTGNLFYAAELVYE